MSALPAINQQPAIKCVVWDLDNTLWDGVLLEDEKVTLRQEAIETVQVLDQRGILNSIASKNEHDLTIEQLKKFDVSDYFLYPQINWNAKSNSLRAIADALNIGMDTFAFVDDQQFERAEVAHELSDVLCIDAANVASILEMPRMQPRFITTESAQRRAMYQSEIKRKNQEEQFTGPTESFLAELQMVFTIKEADEEDLQRAEELTVRTNQLNSTGYTYSYAELDAFRHSPDHLLLVTSLEDKFGPYGTIGLALVEIKEIWKIKLLLMSCRVMSRGVGTILMSHIMTQARKSGASLQAEFVSTNRNRMMFITYKLGGFREIHRDGDAYILEHDLAHIQPIPEHIIPNARASTMNKLPLPEWKGR